MAKSASTGVDSIPVSEFQARRSAVLKALGGAAAVVFSGEGSPPLLGKWRSDQHFTYLTGITDEPGAAVLFDPTAEHPKRRIVLFLKPIDPERDRWDGYRMAVNSTLKARYGFDTILRSGSLPAMLTQAARRSKTLQCLHPFSVYPAPVSADLAAYREVAQRVPGVAIEDSSQLLPGMRVVKSRAELALMQRAVEATAAGYERILGLIRPGASEADLDRELEYGYRAAGAGGVAYNSIVGSGLNGTVLHYMANDQPLKAGDLIVIDSAARLGGYAADVTRTYPVSGRFTPEQREVYQVVLNAELAAIKALRPGVTHTQVDQAAREVIDKAGYGDAFIHNVGHQLGLDVHDVTPDGPLKAGAVMTIEPGIYLPERNLGIRIEDDVLITPRGGRSLTDRIPKTIADIEAAMSKGR